MSRRAFNRYMVEIGAGTHPKLARLSDGERCAHFLGVLAIAAQSPVRGCLLVGELAAEPVDIAAAAGVSKSVAASAVRKLEAVGVLERDKQHDCLRVHDWGDYNPAPKTDSTHAERQRRYRERHRAGVSDAQATPRVTPSLTPGDAVRDDPVTPPEVEVEVEGSSTTSQTLQEARPPAAPGLSAKQVEALFTHWADTCRPGSEVVLTEQRDINIRSRASRDAFTFDQLTKAIDGAAAIECEDLAYARRETEFGRIFVDREHVKAWITYSNDGDPEALQLALEDAEDAAKATVASKPSSGPTDAPGDLAAENDTETVGAKDERVQ